MPDFTYTVKDSSGKTIKASTAADSKEALIADLQQKGYFILAVTEGILSINPQGSSQKIKISRKFTRNGVATQDKLLLARQLATMLDSGVNLMRSLTIVVEQTESKQFYEILQHVRNDVEQGISLNKALSRYPKVFDTLWTSLIEVGEASGTMPRVLNKITIYVEKAEALKSAIISALIYPAILLTAVVGAILVFAIFIGPRFQELYSTLGSNLPGLTQGLLDLFSFIRSKFFILLGSIIIFIMMIRKYLATPIGKVQWEQLLFSLPVLGDLQKTAIMEKFASQMTILVESGVPIIQALDIIERLIGSKICEGLVKQIKKNVSEGKMISEEMAKTNFFPSMAIQMIAVGEETGELAKMLNHVAEYYQRVLAIATQRFTATFEPIMLIVMGGTIGTIIVAMFLPMLNMSSLGAPTAGGGG